MKYGILFSIVSILLTAVVIIDRGWYFVFLWPALSCATVASGYFYLGPSVYGKSQSGVLAYFSTAVLLPYLLYSWFMWYVIRIFKREPAFNRLNDRIYIGRRLMGHEFPSDIDHVIDLTCEFNEPRQLRSVDYHSYQILDGYVPPTEQLQLWVAQAATLDGTTYIHCAEGHGRTGLFATALLVKLGQFDDTSHALEFVISKRPLVRLGKRQLATLMQYKPT